MNFENISVLVIRFFCAYQLFYVCDDVFYLLAKQATDPRYDLYHYTICMMGARTFMAFVMYSLAVPLSRKITKGLA